jgi:hypothetical protein
MWTHRAAQSAGRKGVFRDYRLRVAAVLRDYGMSKQREQAPPDSRAIYDVSVEPSLEAFPMPRCNPHTKAVQTKKHRLLGAFPPPSKNPSTQDRRCLGVLPPRMGFFSGETLPIKMLPSTRRGSFWQSDSGVREASLRLQASQAGLRSRQVAAIQKSLKA